MCVLNVERFLCKLNSKWYLGGQHHDAEGDGAPLQWLEYLQTAGPTPGISFDNRVKGTCARRKWAKWDRLNATWTITKPGQQVLSREKRVPREGRKSLLLSA